MRRGVRRAMAPPSLGFLDQRLQIGEEIQEAIYTRRLRIVCQLGCQHGLQVSILIDCQAVGIRDGFIDYIAASACRNVFSVYVNDEVLVDRDGVARETDIESK